MLGELKSGVSYYITTWAEDNAGNITDWYNINSSTFIVDTTAPEALISTPTAGEPFYSSLSTIKGTSTDITPAYGPLKSGISTVKMTIQDVTPGVAETDRYWRNPNRDWNATTPSTWTVQTSDAWATCIVQMLLTLHGKKAIVIWLKYGRMTMRCQRRQ